MNSIEPQRSGESLVFPEFDDIKVSTKTFIVKTNLILDLKNLFEILNVTDYTLVKKKRGRKKKNSEQLIIEEDLIQEVQMTVPTGSIITLKYENKLKGVDLKQKKNKNKKKKSKWFRNSFTVVIMLDNKPINFKICKNGMFQVTGCKLDTHPEDCIKHIWHFIKDKNDIYTFSKGSNLETLIIPAMRNIDFSVGFLVDREKLARYMSVQTEFHSLLETSFGYTGVNVKIPVTQHITTIEIKKLIHKDDEWVEIMTTYDEYLKHLSKKEQTKKLEKDRYNTFLIFHSGCVIFSGLNANTMRDVYYYFLKIIRRCYNQIEERLDVEE